MEAQEVIVRLCQLQSEVSQHLDYACSADCFCGQGGFWGSEGYGGTFEQGYRNDGKALEFIEMCVHKELTRLKETQDENNRT